MKMKTILAAGSVSLVVALSGCGSAGNSIGRATNSIGRGTNLDGGYGSSYRSTADDYKIDKSSARNNGTSGYNSLKNSISDLPNYSRTTVDGDSTVITRDGGTGASAGRRAPIGMNGFDGSPLSNSVSRAATATTAPQSTAAPKTTAAKTTADSTASTKATTAAKAATTSKPAAANKAAATNKSAATTTTNAATANNGTNTSNATTANNGMNSNGATSANNGANANRAAVTNNAASANNATNANRAAVTNNAASASNGFNTTSSAANRTLSNAVPVAPYDTITISPMNWGGGMNTANGTNGMNGTMTPNWRDYANLTSGNAGPARNTARQSSVYDPGIPNYGRAWINANNQYRRVTGSDVTGGMSDAAIRAQIATDQRLQATDASLQANGRRANMDVMATQNFRNMLDNGTLGANAALPATDMSALNGAAPINGLNPAMYNITANGVNSANGMSAANAVWSSAAANNANGANITNTANGANTVNTANTADDGVIYK